MDTGIVRRGGKKFPKRLLEIEPEVLELYWKGSLDKKIFEKCVGIVGSRRMSAYGQRVVEKIVPELVNAGVTIVSGFMYGVDQAAHRVCLEAGGVTIAVFGWGIDWQVGEDDVKLYDQILVSGGLMLSEYEGKSRSQLWMFPRRNRIVSGISAGVIVVEGAEKSGSLITANWAVKQGRKLFAVPGPVTSSVSAGTNGLIKSGRAVMARSGRDVLEELGWALGKRNVLANEEVILSKEEKQILVALEGEDLGLDELCQILKMDSVKLGQIVTMMEMGGKN